MVGKVWLPPPQEPHPFGPLASALQASPLLSRQSKISSDADGNAVKWRFTESWHFDVVVMECNENVMKFAYDL